jgi:hypothetical protein
VEATASVTFGAGAEFAASIKAPIFGATEIDFKANATLGFGAAMETKISVNFSELGLAMSSEFQKVVHYRMVAKGWKLDLMNQQAKNEHYLNKSINALQKQIISTTNTITTYEEMDDECRPLLWHG